MHTPPTWRISRENARLIGYKCKKCGFVEFPEARRTCKVCRAPAEFAEVQMGSRGRIVSFVVQHRLPEGFQTPLPLAAIDLENGARVYGQIIECQLEELKVGMEVQAELRVFYDDEGLSVYSYKFRPIREAKR